MSRRLPAQGTQAGGKVQQGWHHLEGGALRQSQDKYCLWGRSLSVACSFEKALSSPDASGQGPSLIGLRGCPSQLQAENPGVVSDTPR